MDLDGQRTGWFASQYLSQTCLTSSSTLDVLGTCGDDDDDDDDDG